MAILVMCKNPDCGELFDAPDNAGEQSVRCPACGHVQPLAMQDPPATPAHDKAPPEQPAPPASLADDDMRPTSPAPEASPEPAKNSEPGLPDLLNDVNVQQPDGAMLEDVDGLRDDRPAREASPEKQAKTRALLDSLDVDEAAAETPIDGLEHFDTNLEGILEQLDVPDTPGETQIVSPRAAGGTLLAGLLAAAAGGVLAAGIWPGHIAAAYLGLLAGWCGGVVASVAMTIGLSGADSNELAERRTMLGDCFAAWRYPRSRLGALAAVSLVTGLFLTLLDAMAALTARHTPETLPAVHIALAVAGWLLAAYAFCWMLTAAAQTQNRTPRPPGPPNPASGPYLRAVVLLPMILAMYVLPVVTLPLLPVALVLAATGQAKAALNPLAVGQAAHRYLTGTMVLHLALLTWGACGLMGMALLALLRQAMVRRLDIANSGELALRVGLTAVIAMLLAATVQALALVAGHCVGYFSLYHRSRQR